MLAGNSRTYPPNHTAEVDLITDAVFCKWRQPRAWTSEAKNLEIAIAESNSTYEAAAAAHAFSQMPNKPTPPP